MCPLSLEDRTQALIVPYNKYRKKTQPLGQTGNVKHFIMSLPLDSSLLSPSVSFPFVKSAQAG